MSALDLIIEWAEHDLPDWQSDAVRRLLTQDELTETDKTELLALLKQSYDLGESSAPKQNARPLKRGDVSGAPPVAATLTLKAMTNLANVNAIPDGSDLPFGHQGLTVIYGGNATGKSGYARVLKRACSARDKKEPILPNVFKKSLPQVAEASFKISVNGAGDQEIKWKDGEEPPGVLSNIAVFDSKCARIIIDEKNEATYLPFGTHVFEELVACLKDIRSHLENEKPKPATPEYPQILPYTKAGQFLTRLTHETSINTIDDFVSWSKESEKELLGCSKRLAKAEAEDPGKEGLRLRNLRSRIRLLAERCVQLEGALSDSTLESLRGKLAQLGVAEKAVAIASKESFADEPLTGVGSTVWQELYQAAKSYSIEHAYPRQDFPETGEGSRCVLCMDPLSNDAKKRLRRFKSFMEQSARKKVKDITQQIQEAVEVFSQIDGTELETYKDALDEIRGRNEQDARQIEQFLCAMPKRAKTVLKGIEQKAFAPLQPSPPMPSAALGEMVEQLETEATELEKAAGPHELANLADKKYELESIKVLANKKAQIIDYVKQLAIAKKYDACIAATGFGGITRKGKRIVSQALTPALRSALARELDSLRALDIPLNLRASGVEGETYHKMQLNGRRFGGKAKLSDILSEGEQGIVAIAGFLAELAISGHNSPIVFDDPVTSLDHVYRRFIAHRLAREAVNRQVIVFTHDIALLLELKTKAGELGNVAFTAHTVKRFGKDASGVTVGTLPWHAMPVSDRLSYLQDLVPRLRPLYASSREEYNEKAANLYALLRETWEAAVEEVLLFGTICRHGQEVQTQRLRSVKVTTEDYRAIALGMGKCSTWMRGHDKSKALGIDRPGPDEIESDIKQLRDFIKAIRKRGQELRNEREVSIEPKAPEVG